MILYDIMHSISLRCFSVYTCLDMVGKTSGRHMLSGKRFIPSSVYSQYVKFKKWEKMKREKMKNER